MSTESSSIRLNSEPSSLPTAPHVRRALETQITRLIESSGFDSIASYIMAIIWVGLLWRDLPHEVLGVWLAMMTLLFAFRAIIHYFRLYQVDKKHLPVNVIRRWYLLSVLITGAGWGITSTLMFPINQIEQIALAFLLVGVSATGVTYSHVPWLYYGYIGFALVPLMVRLFYVGGEVYYALSAMTGFFLGVMAMAAYRMHSASASALELSYKNEELINNLTNARNDLVVLNDELTEEIEYVKRIESELKDARDKAERMSRVKGEFLANMSHEIRTPMNGIMGTLQLLEDTTLDEGQLDYVRTASKSAESLLAILNDILDLSKIEAGKMTLEKIAFDWSEIIKDIVTLHSLKAEQQGVQLTSKIDEALPPLAEGDPTRIRQILINLISNALKFTREGEVTIHLKCTPVDEKNIRVRLEVIDTGIGIPQDVQKELFNAFTQADGSTTRKYGGTGLGLTIVKQLVTMMRGQLGVESEVGVGSTFWFEIPLGISHAMLKESKKEEVVHKALSGKVLLVEDNPINQMVATKMLESLGLQISTAVNGVEALEFLSDNKVDVVLMDCQMPEMDGFEATRSLRQREHDEGERGVPVIAMTANVMEGDKQRCLDAGMDDYLGKPVKKEELRDVLERWLN